MSLRGLDVDASDPAGSRKHFDLVQVYVDLNTTSQVVKERSENRRRPTRALLSELPETRPLGILEAVIGQRHLVLLGEPGSGKSTFLTHLALCLATHALEPRQMWLALNPLLLTVMALVHTHKGRLPEPRALLDGERPAP